MSADIINRREPKRALDVQGHNTPKFLYLAVIHRRELILLCATTLSAMQKQNMTLNYCVEDQGHSATGI